MGSLCSIGSMQALISLSGLPLSNSRSSRVGEHGKVMTARATEHEQMPDKVPVTFVIVQEEDHAAAIDHAARHQPKQTRARNRHGQRPNREYDQPSHSKIEANRKARPVICPFSRFENYPEARQEPDNREHRPANRTAERAKREGRVG